MTLENLPSGVWFNFNQPGMNNSTLYKKICRFKFVPTFDGKTLEGNRYDVASYKKCEVKPRENPN